MTGPGSDNEHVVRLHSISGIVAGVYAAIHVLNLAAALGGPLAHGTLQSFLRHFSRHPLLEILGLAVPVLLATISGFLLRRRREAAGASGWQRLNRLTGMVLAAILIPHAVAMRGFILVAGVEPDFHLVAATMRGGRGIVFWAAYGLLVAAASIHLPAGLFGFLDREGAFGGAGSRRAAASILTLLGLTLGLCGLIGLLSFGGVIAPVPSVETLPAD